jgi:hypothetical protein
VWGGCVFGWFGWFVWWVAAQVALVSHPVATLGFPTVVYGAGSALNVCCRPRGFVPLSSSCPTIRWFYVSGHERSTLVPQCSMARILQGMYARVVFSVVRFIVSGGCHHLVSDAQYAADIFPLRMFVA